MRCSKSHIVHDVVYDIVCQATISYTIYCNVRHRRSYRRSRYCSCQSYVRHRSLHRIRYRMPNLRYRIRFRVSIRHRRWEDFLANRRLRRRIRYRRFFYDVVYDVVGPHQVDTTLYSTSYSLLTQCQVDTMSSVSNDMIIRHCYNIRYGLPGAVGAAGVATWRFSGFLSRQGARHSST